MILLTLAGTACTRLALNWLAQALLTKDLLGLTRRTLLARLTLVLLLSRMRLAHLTLTQLTRTGLADTGQACTVSTDLLILAAQLIFNLLTLAHRL